MKADIYIIRETGKHNSAIHQVPGVWALGDLDQQSQEPDEGHSTNNKDKGHSWPRNIEGSCGKF